MMMMMLAKKTKKTDRSNEERCYRRPREWRTSRDASTSKHFSAVCAVPGVIRLKQAGKQFVQLLLKQKTCIRFEKKTTRRCLLLCRRQRRRMSSQMF